MIRYPEIRVILRTSNPMLLVAVVRHELRGVGVARGEISRFSTEALGGGDLESTRRVCSRWVDTSRVEIVRDGNPPGPALR